MVFSYALIGSAYLLRWNPKTISVNLGNLSNTSENHALAARTFKAALEDNPDAKSVKVYLMVAPSTQWQVLYYNRDTDRMYFGPTGKVQTHGSQGQFMDRTESGCIWSEESIKERLDYIIRGEAISTDFETAFSLFQGYGLWGGCT